MRRYVLSDTPNVRDLGGYPTRDGGETAYGKLIRSACPASLSREDAGLLRRLGVTDVVDFRSETEEARQPNPLAGLEGVRLHRMIFFDPMSQNELFGPGTVAGSYLMIAEHPKMGETLRLIFEAAGAVLFHCSAGKDRTGTTAALLMLLAGCYEEDIEADYVLSEVYLKDQLKVWEKDLKAQTEHFPDEWIFPRCQNIRGFLQLFHEKYPEPEAYFRSMGFTPEELAGFRDKIRGKPDGEAKRG